MSGTEFAEVVSSVLVLVGAWVGGLRCTSTCILFCSATKTTELLLVSLVSDILTIFKEIN